jgi:hypothetical protein
LPPRPGSVDDPFRQHPARGAPPEERTDNVSQGNDRRRLGRSGRRRGQRAPALRLRLGRAAPDFAAATARLRDEIFDLVVVPLQNVEPMELAALEREVRRNDSSFIIGTAPRADSTSSSGRCARG